MSNENQGGSQRGGSGNFANDPERASEAGKKGGEHSHGGESPQRGSQKEGGGSRGGSGNFSTDRDKASEAGKKGGEHSHGGR
jgi:general stress protein YciG